MHIVDTRAAAAAAKSVGVRRQLWVWSDGEALRLRSPQDRSRDCAGEVAVAASGEATEAVLVNTKTLLAALAGGAYGEQATLSVTDEKLLVERAGLLCELRWQPSEMFLRPEECHRITRGDGVTLADVPADALAYVLRAVSADITRPARCCLLIEPLGGGVVRLVGTNSYRLHMLDWATDAAPGAPVLVPREVLAAALRSHPETVTVRATATTVEVATPDGQTWSIGAEGSTYPDYRNALGELADTDLAVTMATADLVAALRRIGPIAEDDAHRVLLDAEAMTLHSAGECCGSMTLTVPMDVTGLLNSDLPWPNEGIERDCAEQRVAYNAKYLADALQGEAMVRLQTRGPLNAASILCGPDADNLTRTAVIMPMMIL